MEIFYTQDIDGKVCRLGEEESGHCVKVLRHRPGDTVCVIDGATKNADRYEWFAEKACEVGLDSITPVIGQHSERKVFKTSRIGKILVSASKQSLKGAVPQVNEPVSVKDFILKYGKKDISGTAQDSSQSGSGHKAADSISARDSSGPLRLIAYCFEDETHPRTSIRQVLENYKGDEYIILIGPEGDFSKEEASLAISCGFIPIHLGNSRLRTETAALTAAEAVYLHYME